MSKLVAMKRSSTENNLDVIISEISEVLSEEPIFNIKREHPNVVSHTVVYEKYFVRSSSYAGSTLNFHIYEDNCICDVITFASAGGVLNIDWGAGNKFSSLIVDVLSKHGFVTE